MRGNFQAALDHVLDVEGGYVHRNDDRGGPTNMGITQRTLSEFLKRSKEQPATAEEVRQLNPAVASRVYEEMYWKPLRCDDLPGGVDLMTFDAAVHAGQGQATRWLQQAVNYEAGTQLKEDGVLGSRTLAAVASCPPPNLVRRIAYYRILEAFDDPSDAPFGKGWLDRVLKTFSRSVFLIAARPPCAYPGETDT